MIRLKPQKILNLVQLVYYAYNIIW